MLRVHKYHTFLTAANNFVARVWKKKYDIFSSGTCNPCAGRAILLSIIPIFVGDFT